MQLAIGRPRQYVRSQGIVQTLMANHIVLLEKKKYWFCLAVEVLIRLWERLAFFNKT
jgi:hypothetical protein